MEPEKDVRKTKAGMEPEAQSWQCPEPGWEQQPQFWGLQGGSAQGEAPAERGKCPREPGWIRRCQRCIQEPQGAAEDCSLPASLHPQLHPGEQKTHRARAEPLWRSSHPTPGIHRASPAAWQLARSLGSCWAALSSSISERENLLQMVNKISLS